MFPLFFNTVAIKYNILYGRPMTFGSEIMDQYLHMMMKLVNLWCRTGDSMDGEIERNFKNVQKYHKKLQFNLDLDLWI